jgi:glycosyltransferase involved in cell wall biosynthesis
MPMMTTLNPVLPKVTVVTVVRNSEHLIEKTIQSVIGQTYEPLEYIVIDGLSQDGTGAIIERYAQHIDAFVCEPDEGIYDAMNKAIDLATGTWILFMNAGDCFISSHALSELSVALNSDADVVMAGVSEILKDQLETRVFHRMPRPIKNIWYQMPTSHQATLVRLKEQKLYRFDTRYRWCADHDMLIRMYRHGKHFTSENKLVAVFDCNSEGEHRNPMVYISERWHLSKGMVPLYKRMLRYSWEVFHCKAWGKLVKLGKWVFT